MQSIDTVTRSSLAPPSSDHLSSKQAYQPDIVSNSDCRDETSGKLRQLEASNTQLMRQLSDALASLHLRTLGFEAMVILVKHLTEEVAVFCVIFVLHSHRYWCWRADIMGG